MLDMDERSLLYGSEAWLKGSWDMTNGEGMESSGLALSASAKRRWAISERGRRLRRTRARTESGHGGHHVVHVVRGVVS